MSTSLNNQGIKEKLWELLSAVYGGSIQRPNETWLINQIEALFTPHKKALLEQLEAALPKEMTSNFDFFDKDKKRGWTVEQLEERIWGYNQALADVRTIIGRLK